MSGSLTTGGVDAGIPLQAGKNLQQANPLQQIGQFAGIQNALNQNRLFPGQMQLQQQAVQGGQVGLAQRINQAAYQGLTPILAKPAGTITHEDLTTALGSLEANQGLPTHGVLADLMATAPTGDGPAFDQKVRSMITARAMVSPESAVAQVTGTPTTMANGQQNQPGVVPGAGAPGFGSFQPAGAATQVFPSRGELASQVSRPASAAEATSLGIPEGTPLTETMLGRLQQQGASNLTGPAGMGSGRYSPAPSQAAPGPVVSGMAPGVPESMAAQVGPGQALADRVSHFQSDMYPLTAAQQALAKAPTGLGSEAAHNVSSYLNTFSPQWIQKGLAFVSPIMTPEETTAYDEAKKYLTQGQLGTPGATRSNEGLTTAGAANPSTQITKEAAQVVLKGMVALRRMEQDEGQTWLASGQPPSQLNQFRAAFQKQADPRVYMFDQMTPQQRQQTLAAIKQPAARAAFISSVQRAEQNGVLSAPQSGQ